MQKRKKWPLKPVELRITRVNRHNKATVGGGVLNY